MPHLTFLSWCAWLPAVAVQPALAVVMVRSGAWRRWPSLFSFLSLRSVQSISLLAITLMVPRSNFQGALYFYTYWFLSLIGVFLEAWMLVQIGCAMAGITARIRRQITQAILAAALINLTVSALLALHAHLPGYGNPSFPWWSILSRCVLDLNRSVNLAWLITFLGCAASWEFAGIKGEEPTRSISVGYAVSAIGSTAASWLLGVVRNASAVSNAQDLVYLLALALWARAFLKTKDEKPPLGPEELGSLQDSLKTYVGAFQRMKSTQP